MPQKPLRRKARFRKASCTNVTTVTIHPDDYARLLAAFKHYRIENRGGFFRNCSQALIEHFERGERLHEPLLFQTCNEERTRAK